MSFFDYEKFTKNVDVEDFAKILQKIASDQYGKIRDENALIYYLSSVSSNTLKQPSQNYYTITSLEDLPEPVNGDIILPPGSYDFREKIDLLGSRFVCDGVVAITCPSPEIVSITSTGLQAGKALIKTEYTISLNRVGINDVDTALDLDATANPDSALDWAYCNFLNVPNVGRIANYTNFIGKVIGFLNSGELVFDGTIGTVSFGDTIFVSPDNSTCVRLAETINITRRFRVVYSAAVLFGANKFAFDVPFAATLPIEGYILDTVNFSGSTSPFISGISTNDDRTLFTNCRGVMNTTRSAGYRMYNNLTTTTVASSAEYYKIAGITIANAGNQKFSHTNNRLTYEGALSASFQLTAAVNLNSGNNNVIEVAVYYYDASAGTGTIQEEYESFGTTNGSGRSENIYVQWLGQMDQGDYVELYVRNTSSPNDITVTDMNASVVSISE